MLRQWLADSPDFFQAFSFAFHHNQEAVRIPDQVSTSSGFTQSLLAGGVASNPTNQR
jgi:hypothetical protein